MADLAALTGFSAGHLNRGCRQYYGRQAMKQLALLRLEHAAQLLRRGAMDDHLQKRLPLTDKTGRR
ncbi:MAG: hypothetical protein KKG09_02160 [Verrucomicrobia bacterium]|nr:hypothetical protein [Verrucomicrobiota bacterium]MCG2680769.1 hypothetical protein [Kiritimatiellia bacterium]MBU4246907.1 hypothetical protein [Verrucomicrobiota bacterium]MBU4291295.1 hypothetical protein [Verrucomicrobiota bacterium]MBU4429948.1 hypothetical protein [Verrucomicrobiota bacterium]